MKSVMYKGQKYVLAAAKITLHDLDKMEQFGGGHGYLGHSVRNPLRWKRCCRTIADKLDELVVNRANLKNWSIFDLATFVDSTDGRHLGDELSSCGGKKAVDYDKGLQKPFIVDTDLYLKCADEKIQQYMNGWDKWAASHKEEYADYISKWKEDLVE